MPLKAAENSALFSKVHWPQAGAKILVAVSGGLDSMVLLHVLKKFSVARRWKLTVAHFNHCLRGHASDGDEAFVRRTAETMKLPFVAGRADVKMSARESGASIEMAARRLRHVFFATTAQAARIRTVALAHHADDQVELFFLRLLRGAGGSGLSGMKLRTLSPVDGSISLIRPLLSCSRADLEQFAREQKIQHRNDATNRSVDFLRNRVRHELLPLLRKHYQPSLNKAVLRLMEITGAESDFVDATAAEWLKMADREKGQKRFDQLSLAIQRQVLRRQLNEAGVTGDFQLVESLRAVADRFVAIGPDLSVSRDVSGGVRLRRTRTGAFNGRQITIDAGRAGETVFDGVKLSWKTVPWRSALFHSAGKKAGMESFDAAKIGAEIVLRHWRAGDRFQPIGLPRPVKLQDLFTNGKVSRTRRHQLLLAETNGEIFWVEEMRMSENFKLVPGTNRRFVWRWRRDAALR